MHHVKEKLKKNHAIGIIVTKGGITKEARNMEGNNIILFDLNELRSTLDNIYSNNYKA